MLQRDFYLRSPQIVARELIGKMLVHSTPQGRTAGIIVETEAYDGLCDKGAHSYPCKRTRRTEIQFKIGGYAYVYSIYGMHCCFNAVTGGVLEPQVVLVRALEPVEGIELMQRRRNTNNLVNLCSGPGKLCTALAIAKSEYGADLCSESLYIDDYRSVPANEIVVSPRVNIDYAEECRDYPWRFFVKDSRFVSKVGGRYKGIPLCDAKI